MPRCGPSFQAFAAVLKFRTAEPTKCGLSYQSDWFAECQLAKKPPLKLASMNVYEG